MKFTNKDLNVISNIVTEVLYLNTKDRDQKKQRLIERITVDYNKPRSLSKLEEIKTTINYFTDLNNFSNGCMVEFVGGNKAYYSIHDKQEALNKALNDPFIDREITEILPYFCSDLVKPYLISLGHSV